MILREFFNRRQLNEGGNLEIDGAQAQQIDLKVHNRAYIVPILSQLLASINAGFKSSQGNDLWNPKVLKSRKYLSGSSLHFFNTDIPDDEFERVKPKVGDIDTQVNKNLEAAFNYLSNQAVKMEKSEIWKNISQKSSIVKASDFRKYVNSIQTYFMYVYTY